MRLGFGRRDDDDAGAVGSGGWLRLVDVGVDAFVVVDDDDDDEDMFIVSFVVACHTIMAVTLSRTIIKVRYFVKDTARVSLAVMVKT